MYRYSHPHGRLLPKQSREETQSFGWRGDFTSRPPVLPSPQLTDEDDVFGERLESVAIGLHHRNRDVAGFAGVNVPDNTSFAFVDAADHLAFGAVFELRG